MEIKNIIKKTGEYVKKNLGSLLIIIIPIIILAGISSYLENTPIESPTYTRDSLLILLVQILMLIIVNFTNIEIYLSKLENRKFRSFGFIEQLKKYNLKMIGLIVLISIKTFLWSLLFIIPGVIKALEYQRAVYVLAKNPTMSIGESFAYARKDMRGNKANLFLLEFILLLPTILGLYVYVSTLGGLSFLDGGLSFNLITILLTAFLIFGLFYTVTMTLVSHGIFNYQLDKEIPSEENEVLSISRDDLQY